jgi:hypothetical protein
MISFRVTETSLTGIRSHDSFQDCDVCFCNLLFETNNFGLGAVLLSCLVSELQETPSAGIELRKLLPEFLPCYVLFLVSRNKQAKFGANRYIRS